MAVPVSPLTPAPFGMEAGWLGLTLTQGLGLQGLNRLIRRYATVESIYAASLTELEAAQIAPEAAQAITSGRALELGQEALERCSALQIAVLAYGDPRYPVILKEIADPPGVLYVRGSIEALDRYAMAVVGTRHPTVYGRLMAERLASAMAQWGLTVVSGLARGIDGCAQQACIAAGGITVAVLGTGVEIVYPKEHANLAQQILDNDGALISEFALGTFPAPQNFPIRNRIISGLALGVLIVEGGEQSGSRITARMALEQNREVFAVPGQVTQKQAWLPNALIKQGAKLAAGIEDILEELPSTVRLRLKPPPLPAPVELARPASRGADAETDNFAQAGAVLAVLHIDEAIHVDEIGVRLENRVPTAEILALLFDLEISGRVKQLPGKHFVRTC